MTIHKYQGITIGEGSEKAVITLPPKGTVKNRGMNITAISSASRKEAFEIRFIDSNDILYNGLIFIGHGKAYDQRCLFEQTLKDQADNTQWRLMREVTDLDPNTDIPTFEGGFEHLLRWYHSKIINNWYGTSYTNY